MKSSIMQLIFIVSLITGCSSAYKSTQTPDDVYYSPARGVNEVRQERNKQNDRYQEYLSSNDDRYLSMKVHNYLLWGPLDDYSYWYDSRYNFYNYNTFNTSLGYGWNPYYYNGNPYYYNNNYAWMYGYDGYGYNWYNPVYTLIGYKNPKIIGGTTSGSYLSAYLNKSYNNYNYIYNLKSGNTYNNGSSFGNLVRRVFTANPSSNNPSYSNSWDRPARTFSTYNNAPFSTSSSAGGRSGGYNSTGSSSSSSRGSRGGN